MFAEQAVVGSPAAPRMNSQAQYINAFYLYFPFRQPIMYGHGRAESSVIGDFFGWNGKYIFGVIFRIGSAVPFPHLQMIMALSFDNWNRFAQAG